MCQVALFELASGTSSCCSEHPLSSLGIPPLFDLGSPSSRSRLLFPLPGQTSRILPQMGSNQSLGIPLKPPSIMRGYLHHMLSQTHLNCHSRPLKPKQEKPLPRGSNQNSLLFPAITYPLYPFLLEEWFGSHLSVLKDHSGRFGERYGYQELNLGQLHTR